MRAQGLVSRQALHQTVLYRQSVVGLHLVIIWSGGFKVLSLLFIIQLARLLALPLRILFHFAPQLTEASLSGTSATSCKSTDMRKALQTWWQLWTERWVDEWDTVVWYQALQVAGHRPDYPSMPEYTSTMSKKFQFRRTAEGVVSGVEKKLKDGLFYQLQNQFITDRVNRGSQAWVKS